MNDTQQVLNLMNLVRASHADGGANNDPVLRKTLEEAISLVQHMVSDRSWADDSQAKDGLIKSLTQMVATLQTLSNRANQN